MNNTGGLCGLVRRHRSTQGLVGNDGLDANILLAAKTSPVVVVNDLIAHTCKLVNIACIRVWQRWYEQTRVTIAAAATCQQDGVAEYVLADGAAKLNWNLVHRLGCVGLLVGPSKQVLTEQARGSYI